MCGVPGCQATVHAGGATKQPDGAQYAMYRCGGTMAHVSRAAGPCDWWVGEVVIARLSRKDAATLLERDKGPDAKKLRLEAQALRTRRDSLARLLAEDVLTEAGVRQESGKIKARLAEIEQQQADAGRVSLLGPLIAAEDVRKAWQALDTDRQRAVIDLLMTVTLLPPGRGTRFGKTVEQWEDNAQRIAATVVIDWK